MSKLVPFVLGVFVCVPILAQQQAVTLQQSLERAVGLFSDNQFEEAFEALEQLEATFGREQEFLSDDVQRLILPIRGYAAFASGRPADAIAPFQNFLESFPEERQARLVLYSLARAQRSVGELIEAADTFKLFAERFPRQEEAMLARLQRLELLYEAGLTEVADAESRAFWQDDSQVLPLRQQVRLRMLQQLVKREMWDVATDLLFEEPWRVGEMPEIAILAFEALRIGDRLMESERPADAIRAYRLVPPKQTLIAKQEKLLQELKDSAAAYETRAGRRGAAWSEYYQNLIGRTESLLNNLREMEDYTGGLLLRLGQAFLLADRHREAWLVFRGISEDETQDLQLREQAHYRWILAAYQNGRYKEALDIAAVFVDRYGESELAPKAVYLVARTYQDSGQYADAIPVLQELIANFPDHPLIGEWTYTLGFNFAMMSDYENARKHFTVYQEMFPDGPYRVLSAFWHALSHHFERNNQTALSELDNLIEELNGHPFYPEVLYRRANVLYAMRDFDAAESVINDFLDRFFRHLRAPEARVLLGDIRMGQGRLEEAADLFSRITPEAEQLFFYAVFQSGKIYRALEKYEEMITHFTRFIEREDVPQPQRLSEALYWIGWAFAQKGKPESAFPVFMNALDQFGNDPTATEIQGILTALGDLHRRQIANLRDLQADESILQYDDFNDWVEAEAARQWEKRNSTYFSRLNLYLARHHRNRGDLELSRSYLFEIAARVPRSRLDAEGLAEIGVAILDLGLSAAERFFDDLLERFPGHYERAAAFYGRARLFKDANDPDSALAWVNRFASETPMHPLSFRSTLLRGELLAQLSRYDEADETFESLLQLRQARGRPHASALAGLARLNEARGNIDRAIPYWQRIYTLYRVHTDLVFEAYVESARLFEKRGDIEAAFRSLQEMLREDRFRREPGFEKASAEFERLSVLVKELETTNSEEGKEAIQS